MERRYLVSLQKCESYDLSELRSMVSRLLEPFGGMAAFVKPGQRVLLKPNLIVPRTPNCAVTTHPEIVHVVAEMVLAAGATPFIGDSPAFGLTRHVARVTGMQKVADDLGLEIADLSKSPILCKAGPDSPFPNFRLGRAAVDADVIINLPKLKAHCQMKLSLGSKNLFGTVAGKRKALFHFRNGEDPFKFGKLLIAINQYLKPSLTIIDGILALQKDGPTSGDPRPLGILAASTHPVAVDCVVAELLGLTPDDIPYLGAAQDMHYGPSSLEEIELTGTSPSLLRVDDFEHVQILTPISFTLPRVIKSTVRHLWLILRSSLKRI